MTATKPQKIAPKCADRDTFKVDRRFANECKHAANVRAWALVWKGQPAGSLVANFSDNPNGSVCTATVRIYAGPLKDLPIVTGRAGGYGYDKFSAAVDAAMSSGITNYHEFTKSHGVEYLHGAGDSVVESLFTAMGYVVARAL